MSTASADTGLNLLRLSDPKIKTLHLTWFAFFLTFAVWFAHAPLLSSIQASLELTDAQIRALLILNVAITIPARIIVGMLVDKVGPRIIYAVLLIVSAFLCIGFAFATTYTSLAIFRFLLGFVGAGFVIGIRLVSEWFPAHQVGTAEGIYGGWGNFGSAAAAMILPTLALAFGGDDGWRYAIALVGLICGVYGFVFYAKARNTPKGSIYFKPKKSGAMLVSSWGALWALILMNIPMYLALAILAWRLSPSGVNLYGDGVLYSFWAALVIIFIYQTWTTYQVNAEHLRAGVPELEKYSFKQVAILNVAYFATFGSELAVVSMLPLYFLQTFEGLTAVTAGLLASAFAFMNLVSRPMGGWFSDRYGRRRSLLYMIAGLALGYFMMGLIDSHWWLVMAVLVTMACSFFVQAGEGAVFAMIPLIKRSMTGQIAGMAGAYGNVGAVIYLTVLSFVSYSTFFYVIAASALIGFVAVWFMDNPRGHIAEVMPDGTVHTIEVGHK
ncbi:NarK family nitrate/nitrite MFS transporter [Aliidiomarina sanyensis]|uniref:Nitrate/nitrite transporter n=1 Tax=Aliidiomarina sanyensis TaxID=1249555 RepID=A0A432WRF5_9GAMM|nr:NarK family nitrate/nitrite MFS transporter [Aliidiomarina sanyensis]RUO36392.1 MFS transporter [Aliidiomarina sanyensis]